MENTEQNKVGGRGGGGGKGREEMTFLAPPPLLVRFFRFFFPPLSISSHSPTNWTPETGYHNNRAQFNSNYFFERPGSHLDGTFWSLIC